MTSKHYVGVDIGGTNIRIVIANEDELLVKAFSKTVKQGPPESVANQIRNLIHRGMDEIGITDEDIAGIGTSSAGPFVGGKSLATPNICGDENNDWTVIPYLQLLEKYFGPGKKYELENDCVSAVKAEHLFGAGKGHQNVVYITISTGVGSGIISNGVLMEGKGKNAGHLGHTIVDKDGYRCSCGQKGCIETILSGKYLPRRAKDAGLEVENAKELFELYKKGNEIAQKVIQETIEYLGVLFINAINTTDTEVIIVGGSVFLNNLEILKPAVEKYMIENSMVVLSEGVDLVTPQLGEYVGSLAGLSLVIPTNWIASWVEREPWKDGIKKEIEMSLEESMEYSKE